MKQLSVPMLDGIPKIDAAFYGVGGVGKTTLMVGFAEDPRTSPLLWLNARGNPHLFVLDNSIQYGYDLSDFHDLYDILDYLGSGQNARHPLVAKLGLDPDIKFKSVVIDTLSYVQQLLIDYVVESKKGAGRRKQDPNLVKVEAQVHGPEIAGTTLKIMRGMLALPLHTFVSYQLYPKLDVRGSPDGSIDLIRTHDEIQLYGASRSIIPPWHNLMGLLKLEPIVDAQGSRKGVVAYWRDTATVGKNQIAPALGEKLIEPTAEKILDAIEECWRTK